jgi:hypothetical protein
MKEPTLNDDQAREILEQVLAFCRRLHPISRRPLVVEAKRLWNKLRIPGPPPAVVERRPGVLAAVNVSRADTSESAGRAR